MKIGFKCKQCSKNDAYVIFFMCSNCGTWHIIEQTIRDVEKEEIKKYIS